MIVAAVCVGVFGLVLKKARDVSLAREYQKRLELQSNNTIDFTSDAGQRYLKGNFCHGRGKWFKFNANRFGATSAMYVSTIHGGYWAIEGVLEQYLNGEVSEVVVRGETNIRPNNNIIVYDFDFRGKDLKLAYNIHIGYTEPEPDELGAIAKYWYAKNGSLLGACAIVNPGHSKIAEVLGDVATALKVEHAALNGQNANVSITVGVGVDVGRAFYAGFSFRRPGRVNDPNVLYYDGSIAVNVASWYE